MQLVSNPWQFDVMVTTNLQGTIISNLVNGLIGGPGLSSGKNFGPEYAIFEPGTRNTGSGMVVSVGSPYTCTLVSHVMAHMMSRHPPFGLCQNLGIYK